MSSRETQFSIYIHIPTHVQVLGQPLWLQLQCWTTGLLPCKCQL